MARMRTVNQAFLYLKSIDKDTAITAYAIRSVAQTGDIKTVYLNKKILLDLDGLLEYFGMEDKKDGNN